MGKHNMVFAAAALALAACSSGGGTSGGALVTPAPTPTPAPVPTPTATPTPMPATAWSGFVDARFETVFALDPVFAASLGRHEFDGRLPDFSDAGFRRIADFWRETIAQANAFTGLDAAQRFDRDHLVQVARGQIFWIEDADLPHRNPSIYINGGLDPGMYLTREYADAPTRMRGVTNLLLAVPAAAAQIRANLRMPMAAPLLNHGATTFGGFATFYTNEVPAAFAGVGTAVERNALTAAANAASQAMTDLAQWLNSNAATATQDFALGADRYLRMLNAVEGVTTTIDDLQRAGTADLQRNQAALTAACAAYAPALTVAQCVGRMESNAPGDGMLAAANRQITELRNFIAAQDLLTIPSTEPLLVRNAPAYFQAAGAYFSPAGPFEATPRPIYYINSNVAFGEADLLFVTVHEAMPGHFLQFLHSDRAASKVAQALVGYGFAEGWGHYAEEMMWDAGLRATQEAHIGQLVNALLRNCRFLASVGLHARGMTFAEATAMFRDQCHTSAGSANGQAARGAYDPMYLMYTLGKLMITRLRNDWTATRGGRAAWKAFHDQVLSRGGPPIPLLRQAMMGEASPVTAF